MAHGTLRVYLGAAPGVGKTFAMLNEGRRRCDRGTDVIVGYVETHGRARTADQIGDLEVVVPAAIASLGLRARDVVVDVPETVPPIDADPALLERVVANLLDNAMTHGQGDCPVRVEAGAAAGEVLLRVIDRGTGIPLDQREQVFHPFQRLDDSKPRSGAGVGVGLAVARGFARAMGGDLTVEDTPGGGTTMIVELETAR